MPRAIALLILLAACSTNQNTVAFKICLGGAEGQPGYCTASEVVVGAVLGAHALNHDPYDAVKELWDGDGGSADHRTPLACSPGPPGPLLELADAGS